MRSEVGLEEVASRPRLVTIKTLTVSGSAKCELHFQQTSNKMASIDSLLTLTLDLPPSCIEFWSRDPQYAVVGTYNLEKEDGQGLSDPAQHEGKKTNQQRNGSLILVRVKGDVV